MVGRDRCGYCCKISGILYASRMIQTGRMNRLTVIREVDFGCYLDGGEADDILLPKRYLPPSTTVGDQLDLFVYRDSEDRLIATTETPRAMVGEFALMKVIDVTPAGAFLDWGLAKDLLVPFAEQRPRMQLGKSYIVRVYLDEESDRVVGSTRLDDFLYDESEDEFKCGEPVSMLVAGRSDLGYRVIVEQSHWGLLHDHEVTRRLNRGERLNGFIKRIREDGRIDLTLYKTTRDRIADVATIIVRELERSGGFMAVNDKSSPTEIEASFGVSKALYKKAVGSLYKQKIVALESNGIRLLNSASSNSP